MSNFEKMDRLRRAIALYESSMDTLIRTMMEKGVSTKELANELNLSPKEIEQCQDVLEARMSMFELLKAEREEIKIVYEKEIGERIVEICQDKGISDEELANKLHLSISEAKKLQQCKYGERTFGEGKAIDREFLKKLSGVLGVPYTDLLGTAGYNCLSFYPEFYTEDGEEINVDDMLIEIYYKDPSKIARLKELIL